LRTTRAAEPTAAVLLTAAVIAFAMVPAGCSAANPPSATPSAVQPSTPSAIGGAVATGGTSPVTSQGFEFKGTITVTGAATVTTTFAQLNPAVAGGDASAQGDQQTCAKAAVVGDANFGIGASGDTWQVPNRISDLTAPATVNATIASKQWRGPGTYGVRALLGTSGVRINNATCYDLSSASAASLTVNPDGSGSITFQGAPVSGQSSPTISGSVTWTCINR
jgi:hypothetical protein